MTAIRWLWSYLQPYRARYIVLTVLVALPNFFYGYTQANVVREIIRRVRENGNLGQPLFIYTLCFLATTLLLSLSTYYRGALLLFMEHEMRVRVFARVQNRPLALWGQSYKGEISTYYQTDIPAVISVFDSRLSMFLSQSFVIIGGLATMLVWQSMLALVSFGISIMMVVLSHVIGSKRRALATQQLPWVVKIEEVIMDVLKGIHDVKVYCLRKQMGERVTFALENAGVVQRKEASIAALAVASGAGLSILVWIMTPLVGYFLIRNGETDVETVLAVSLYASRYLWVYRNMPGTVAGLKAQVPHVRRIAEILGTIEELNEVGQDRASTSGSEMNMDDAEGDLLLKVDNLSFCYPDGTWGCRDLSFCVKKGEIIGIAGASGSGKSTLFKLLLGLYTHQEGAVLTRRRAKSETDLTEQFFFAYMPQQGGILPDTVAANISIGKLLDQDAIASATRLSKVDSFVAAMPQGYDTVIGGTHATVSSGQAQRIVLARVFAHEAEILLLDEPTAQLDHENEADILDNLCTHLGEKACLVISHRPAVLARMDRIIVLDSGSIWRIDTHSNLMASSKYRALMNDEEGGKS